MKADLIRVAMERIPMLRSFVFILLFNAAAALAGPPKASSPVNAWQAGTHFRELKPAQATQTSKAKIEVMEVFWYGCVHCDALESNLASWLASKPDDVEFVRVPVLWKSARPHARLFYTLQALNRTDLHKRVFDAIYRQGNPLVATDDEQTFALQREFARAHGIQAQDFETMYRSPLVEGYLQRADDITRNYKIDAVPAVIVNGKYLSNDDLAGGMQQLIDVVDYLVAQEQKRSLATRVTSTPSPSSQAR